MISKIVQVMALENYEGSFRVLGWEDYNLGREAEFSPMDIALWAQGEMAKIHRCINRNNWHFQSNRWYHWRIDFEPPISFRQWKHTVPTCIWFQQMPMWHRKKKIKKDDLVYDLKGALIEIQAPMDGAGKVPCPVRIQAMVPVNWCVWTASFGNRI